MGVFVGVHAEPLDPPGPLVALAVALGAAAIESFLLPPRGIGVPLISQMRLSLAGQRKWAVPPEPPATAWMSLGVSS